MHATGPIAIASIQAASTANSIHQGKPSMKRASPTQGGRWLAQTNYDALMTHHILLRIGRRQHPPHSDNITTRFSASTKQIFTQM